MCDENRRGCQPLIVPKKFFDLLRVGAANCKVIKYLLYYRSFLYKKYKFKKLYKLSSSAELPLYIMHCTYQEIITNAKVCICNKGYKPMSFYSQSSFVLWLFGIFLKRTCCIQYPEGVHSPGGQGGGQLQERWLYKMKVTELYIEVM